MKALTDQEHIRSTRNVARFFVEHHGIAWLLMSLTVAWGAFAYSKMPQRKDPKTSVREALIVAQWPGATATQVEELLTKRIEAVVAQNAMVSEVRSSSRPGIAVVNIELDEFHVKDTNKEFDDIGIKLSQIGELPAGSGPIQYVKDFGNTAALMLTVASPPVSEIELSLRAHHLTPALAASLGRDNAVAVVFCYPHNFETADLKALIDLLSRNLEDRGFFSSLQITSADDAFILNGTTSKSDAVIEQAVHQFARNEVGMDELHPDIWPAVVVRNPQDLEEKLREASPDKYSYRQLEIYSDQIVRSLQKIDTATRVDRTGTLPEEIHLLYDPNRLAALKLNLFALSNMIHLANVVAPAGEINAGSRTELQSSTAFRSISEIANLPLPSTAGRNPGLLQDAVKLERGYQGPPTFLNFYNYRDASGTWRKGRAVTITAELRDGRQISEFSRDVDLDLEQIRKVVPADLIVERTSDQPRQVRENIHLFTTSLWEAIGLVVIVSLIGFYDWRSAALMAISIPVTLAMTAGMMAAVGIDLQQVSIASLIIALGLLVDDPVVAGDAIKREINEGKPRGIAAWLGPTKLARAILFATITNILAYLPFLLLHGDTGAFIYSLPVVITCSLIASRLVSMTFVPLLGQFLLRSTRSDTSSVPVSKEYRGFPRFYYPLGRWCIDHRKLVLVGALIFLLGGGALMSRLDSSFFPYDLQYLAYADVWLPQGASFGNTRATTEQIVKIMQEVSDAYAKDKHAGKLGPPVLKSLTTFIGGGGPRFWDSVSPETPQSNYAEVLLETTDKHDTSELVPRLQGAISQRVPGARVDVRQLETGPPIAAPVAIRILGPDPVVLHRLSDRLQSIFRALPSAVRVRDDWGDDPAELALNVDAARAAVAGVTNEDIVHSSQLATTGVQVGTYLENDQMLPIVLRQQLYDRAVVSDTASQYVYSSKDQHSVPLGEVAHLELAAQADQIRHFNHWRAITVSCFPAEGALASTVLDAAQPQIEAMAKQLPAGYSILYAGEYKEQNSGFEDLAVALGVSVLAIYLALMLQFKNVIKPLIVFAAIPFGCVGAFVALFLMHEPFGFMAFLGVASLIGVIVSHIIVLFDYIEEQHEKGESLLEALLDAGLLRLRPVLITVGATVFALFPLAAHGGPLWEPLCYAQIGGLLFSTLVTLLLVPTLYAFVVLDLKWVHWESCEYWISSGRKSGDLKM